MAAAAEEPPPYDGVSHHLYGEAPYNDVLGAAKIVLGRLRDLHLWKPPPYTILSRAMEQKVIPRGVFYARDVCQWAPNSKYTNYVGLIPVLDSDLLKLVYSMFRGLGGDTFCAGGKWYSTYRFSGQVAECVEELLREIRMCHGLGVPPPIHCPIRREHDVVGLREGEELEIVSCFGEPVEVNNYGARLRSDENRHLFAYEFSFSEPPSAF